MTVLWVSAVSKAHRYSIILGNSVTVVTSARQAIAAVSASAGEGLVVIGSDVEMYEAFATASQLQALRPSLGTVMARERADAATYALAMNSGVRFLVVDGDAAELLAATQRSLSITAGLQDFAVVPEPSKRGQLIMVFSAKGGCGKTTVSTNLAVALAADQSHSVCLVDLDLQFGDVAIALNLEPRRNIADALELAGKLSAQNIETFLTKCKTNLSVLLSPFDPAHIESITPELVGEVLKNLISAFDYVVVDTPPAITDVIIEAIDLADECVLVTTLDAPSIKNLKLAMATLDGLQLGREKWRVVANLVTTDGIVSLTELERAIGMPVSLAVPASRLVAQSVNLGKAAIELNPLDPASVSFQLLAQKLQADSIDDKPRSILNFVRPLLSANWAVKR
jgi:pilus assembly protein CpaE